MQFDGINGISNKVKVLAFVGGLILVVALLLIALMLLFMCSPDFHLEKYGLWGILEGFAILVAGVALGIALLLWAKKCENREVLAKGEAFLRDLFGSGIVRRVEQEGEG